MVDNDATDALSCFCCYTNSQRRQSQCQGMMAFMCGCVLMYIAMTMACYGYTAAGDKTLYGVTASFGVLMVNADGCQRWTISKHLRLVCTSCVVCHYATRAKLYFVHYYAMYTRNTYAELRNHEKFTQFMLPMFNYPLQRNLIGIWYIKYYRRDKKDVL